MAGHLQPSHRARRGAATGTLADCALAPSANVPGLQVFGEFTDKALHQLGRINDVGLYGDEKRKAAWTRMRKVQEKLGDDDPLGAWIDTDDFITEDHIHAKGNIHYLGEMPEKLGNRFGEAALKQLVEVK